MNLIEQLPKRNKKHRLRVVSGGPDIFEDLLVVRLFLPVSSIERILMKENEVSLRKVDYINAQPKLCEPKESVVKETSPIKINLSMRAVCYLILFFLP